ncbi:MAG: copper resistance protein CopC [Candidatus Nanopelagicaceae bacterium]|nr:copper resistance protein CopC [Candidatus Nanopelagicaceae bacterium]
MIRSRNVLLAVLILWIGLPLPAAFAHAGLVSSTPESGAHLAVLPSQVKLEFGENLLTLGDAQTNVLVVKDPDGIQIDKSDSTISGRFLSVRLNSGSKAGTFTVDWRIVSEDGHPVEGSFRFSVTSSSMVVPMVSPSPSVSATPTSSAGRTKGIGGEEGIGFWDQYQSRILLGTLFIIAVIIWVRFKMRGQAGKSDGL